MISFCIGGVSSNSGKTILTTALLYYFKDSVRGYKIGPDFIDPQFHTKISQTPSINLDSFIMNKKQVKWIYNNYNTKKVSILEGVMGFYDGENKGCSTYGISKLLKIPTILILDGSGSYITVSAVLKGILKYKKDNTIKAVVLNNLSSQVHYELIRNQILKDHKGIVVLGWIKKNLPSLTSTHLGLDLKDLSKIEQISKEVLSNIDIKLLKKTCKIKRKINKNYPFEKIVPQDKTIAVVNDKNFSFLYYDNLQFLKEKYKKVILIDSTKNEVIPKNVDIVYICGGYIETNQAYNRIENNTKFKNSLIKHSKTKQIYAECAGLLYLGCAVDDKQMSGILDVSFTLKDRFQRLGYYYNQKGIKGHCFHYTKALSLQNACDILSKTKNGGGLKGSWKQNKVFGTYLHTMFRNTKIF